MSSSESHLVKSNSRTGARSGWQELPNARQQHLKMLGLCLRRPHLWSGLLGTSKFDITQIIAFCENRERAASDQRDITVTRNPSPNPPWTLQNLRGGDITVLVHLCGSMGTHSGDHISAFDRSRLTNSHPAQTVTRLNSLGTFGGRRLLAMTNTWW